MALMQYVLVASDVQKSLTLLESCQHCAIGLKGWEFGVYRLSVTEVLANFQFV